MKKLQKYLPFINTPWGKKLQILRSAKVDQSNSSFTITRKDYQQQNFISLTAFDSTRTQNLLKLHTYRQNSRSPTPKAVIALFNGLGAHSNLGGHVAHYFAERNITTVSYDYRGFGKSDGSTGYIQSLDTHMKDAQKFIDLVKKVYPSTPLFAAGLSLGGLTAYQLTLKHPELFKGAILLAPALQTSMELSNKINIFINLAKFAQFFLPEKLNLLKSRFEALCRFPQPLQILKKDPFFLKEKKPIRTMINILDAMRTMPQTFSEYNSPFMIVMGGRDRLVDPHVAFELMQRSKTAEDDKEILFYQDMWHIIMYEPEIIEIQEKIADWILSRS